MTCSKLFSGDLPELSTYIIQNLHNNINALHSLTLVSRFWCLLFSGKILFLSNVEKNLTFHFLDSYFLFLNENYKIEMRKIKSHKFDTHKPLFNYPSLIKTLNLQRMQVHVANWLNTTSYNDTFTSLSKQSSNKKSCLCLTKIHLCN